MNSSEDMFATRLEIGDLVARYAHGLDAGDVNAVVQCFAPDAIAEYESGAVRLEGTDAIRTLLDKALISPSTHLLSNTLIDLSGDKAHVRCAAIACVTRRAGFVTARGLQYRFQCERRPGGWHIVGLHHSVAWEFAIPAAATGSGAPPRA